jgi:hypothetical protein
VYKRQQQAYIKSYINDFEAIMQGDDFAQHVADWIDIDAFIDFFLINELSKNVDGYRLSTFFYKQKDTQDRRLKVGPVWDFNLAFGNADYYKGWNTDGWQVEYYFTNQVFRSDPFFPAFWWLKVFNHLEFKAKAAERWDVLRQGVFSLTSINSRIDSVVQVLGEAVERNYERWPEVLGCYVWPNPIGWRSRYTYENEVAWMKTWIEERITWMDNEFGALTSVVGVDQSASFFKLLPSFPNPFQENTTIAFHLEKGGRVTLNVFDIAGRHVKQLCASYLGAGLHQFKLSAEELASGVYFYQLQWNGEKRIQKGVLNK